MDQYPIEWIGWAASAVLFITLGTQLRAQWRARSSKGVSQGLYIGQIVASSGFAIYSWLIRNWVFVVTNALLLMAAVGGLILWRHFARGDARGEDATAVASEDDSDEAAPILPPGSAESSIGGRRWSLDGFRRRITGSHPRPTGRWG